jgi:hypothetical protein
MQVLPVLGMSTPGDGIMQSLMEDPTVPSAARNLDILKKIVTL